MRMPHREDPREPWADGEVAAFYTPSPAAAFGPAEVYVDEDNTDRVPFGFQPPTRRRTSTRPVSRQARANRTRREIR